MLGFAGSTERQLRPLASWYERRGSKAIAFVPPIVRNMAWSEGWALTGRQLRERVRATRAKKLQVHVMSNAGFWSYAALLEALNDVGELELIEGAVVDSAPGFSDAIGGNFYAKYSTMALMPSLLTKTGREPAIEHPVLTPPMRAFMRLWYAARPDTIRRAEGSLELVAELAEWPQLFLYSHADRLVPSKYVESFIQRLGCRQRPTQAKCWADSPHIRHMLLHRREYFDAIEEFWSV